MNEKSTEQEIEEALMDSDHAHMAHPFDNAKVLAAAYRSSKAMAEQRMGEILKWSQDLREYRDRAEKAEALIVSQADIIQKKDVAIKRIRGPRPKHCYCGEPPCKNCRDALDSALALKPSSEAGMALLGELEELKAGIKPDEWLGLKGSAGQGQAILNKGGTHLAIDFHLLKALVRLAQSRCADYIRAEKEMRKRVAAEKKATELLEKERGVQMLLAESDAKRQHYDSEIAALRAEFERMRKALEEAKREIKEWKGRGDGWSLA